MKGIMLNEEGDLALMVQRDVTGEITGGWVVDDCVQQVTERVLIANRGEFKEVPLVGGELILQVNGSCGPFYKGRVKNMLEAMRVSVRQIQIEENGINIEIKNDENL